MWEATTTQSTIVRFWLSKVALKTSPKKSQHSCKRVYAIHSHSGSKPLLLSVPLLKKALWVLSVSGLPTLRDDLVCLEKVHTASSLLSSDSSQNHSEVWELEHTDRTKYWLWVTVSLYSSGWLHSYRNSLPQPPKCCDHRHGPLHKALYLYYK